jgi:hypothetical protein
MNRTARMFEGMDWIERNKFYRYSGESLDYKLKFTFEINLMET